MRRYIVLLLITGIVWAQTDFDKLVLKNGTTYFGEYSKTEGDRAYFRHQDALAFQSVPVKLIKQLQLKDGQIIIVGGKVKNSLTLEEYQKLSTKEKAIYDANKVNMGRWALYSPLSGVTIAGFMFLAQEAWEEDVSIPASLAISYLILNLKKVEFSYPESLANEYDKLYYKKVYYKNIKKRKTIIIMASSIIIGGLGLLAFTQAMKGFDMGPQPPGPY